MAGGGWRTGFDTLLRGGVQSGIARGQGLAFCVGRWDAYRKPQLSRCWPPRT